MSKHLFLASSLLMTICSFAYGGGFTKGDAGTSAAQFLTLGAGARSSGMGNAGVAVSTDADGIYWNPSGLADLHKASLSMMRASWFGDIAYSWLGYAQPVKFGGTVGVGVQYLSYGTIAGTDDLTGASNGNFSPNDLSASLVYGAHAGKDLSLGLGVKYIRSKIRETGQTFAGEAGLLYRPGGGALSIGAAVQNLGGTIKYVDVSEKLPVTLRAGLGYNTGPVVLALDAAAVEGGKIGLGGGGEYKCAMGNRMTLTGRAGYNTTATAAGGLAGVTLGAGFDYKDYVLDYAFVPFGDLGNTYRVSLNMKF